MHFLTVETIEYINTILFSFIYTASQEVDILLLSVKCTHSALILSFTKNTSKGEDVDLSPYQLYGVDFECFSLSNTSQLKVN